MFADDLLIIDRLRTEAINVQEPHVSGISRLVTYAAQLKWLGGKFPIDVSLKNQPSICGKWGGIDYDGVGWSGLSVVSCIWIQYIEAGYMLPF